MTYDNNEIRARLQGVSPLENGVLMGGPAIANICAANGIEMGADAPAANAAAPTAPRNEWKQVLG